MDVKVVNDVLSIESIGVIGIDNDYISDFRGCRVEIGLADLNTIYDALILLRDGGLDMADIETRKPSIGFLKEDDDNEGEYVETDYLSADWDDELVTGHALECGLSLGGDGLRLAVRALPKYSDGTFYGLIGTLPLSSFRS